MSGALMQLATYGTQDFMLSGNPQISFFSQAYMRYTNFAIEQIEHPFDNDTFGSTLSCVIPHDGDLIHHLHFKIELSELAVGGTEDVNNLARWVSYLGEIMIKEVNIKIGSITIDKHYSNWLHIWNKLTLSKSERELYNKMIGNVIELADPGYFVKAIDNAANKIYLVQDIDSNNRTLSQARKPKYTLHIPLQFWFNRNPGLALPLIALPSVDVKIEIKLNSVNKLYYYNLGVSGASAPTAPTISKASLLIDYVFLDTDERRRFANKKHEYLIDQVQEITDNVSAGNYQKSVELTQLRHPVKELIWVAQANHVTDYSTLNSESNESAPGGNGRGAQWFNYSNVHWPQGEEQYTNNGSSSIDYRLGGTNMAQSSGEYTNDEEYDFVYRDLIDDLPAGATINNPILSARLQVNGQDRIKEMPGSYFSDVQVHEHHPNAHNCIGINVYSFSLRPEEYQPSGTMNFSRVNNAKLYLKFDRNFIDSKISGNGSTVVGNTGASIKVYAVNYNVLKVSDGNAGLSYN